MPVPIKEKPLTPQQKQFRTQINKRYQKSGKESALKLVKELEQKHGKKALPPDPISYASFNHLINKNKLDE